ncbi:uncharacterized protein TNCV_1409971 [Trichonephila clavipes]|nr:uncharacterized protein TNCV_1409971 [Trichonephila clavipes]
MLKIPREPVFGLDAFGKIKSLVQFRIIRARVPPSGEETGCQNYIAKNKLRQAGLLNRLLYKTVVPSLVVRASDSRSEGLGSYPMPQNTLRVHMEYVLVESGGPKVLWAESRVQETGEYFPPLQSHDKIVEVKIGGVAIYRPFGEFRRDNSYCHLEANPQVYVETPLHPEKLTVWCALWAGGIIGPYFFKNDEGHNVTVNGDRYRAMITNFFIPELNNHDVQELWFQQDGATCHTARATIDLLKDTFGDRLISRFEPVNWPPRSCDLTPLDYFL